MNPPLLHEELLDEFEFELGDKFDLTGENIVSSFSSISSWLDFLYSKNCELLKVNSQLLLLFSFIGASSLLFEFGFEFEEDDELDDEDDVK
jgi:hypothetical protein